MKRLVLHRRTAPIVTAAAVAVTVAFLGWLVWRERAVFVEHAWRIQWGALAAAILPLYPALALVAVAWAHIMRTLGSQATWLTHLHIYVSAHLARRLPGTFWYVVGRGYLYQQRGESVRLVSAASGLELVVMTLAGGIVTLLLGARLLRDLPGTYFWLLVGLVGAALALSHPRTVRAGLRWAGVDDPPLLHYGHIAIWIVLYAVVWLLGGVMLYLIAYGLVQTGPEYLPYIVAAWTLTGTLSVIFIFLPSNFGFTEIALSVLLSAIMPSSLAVVVAVGSRIVIIVLEVIVTGSALGVLRLYQRRNDADTPNGSAEYPQGGIAESAPGAYVGDGKQRHAATRGPSSPDSVGQGDQP